MVNVNDSEFENKIKEFEKNTKWRKKNEKGWENHSKFIKLFPFHEKPDLIDNLTPDKIFNPKKGREDYFFLWIEVRTRDIGHLRIGSAYVFWNARKEIEKFKNLLKIAVSSAPLSEKIDASWEDIKGFGLDKQVAKKIIFCYSPKILPIFKTDDLEHFADILDLDYRQEAFNTYGKDYDILSLGQKFELFNNIILNFKSKNKILNKWDNAFFSRFLYVNFTPSRPKYVNKKHEPKPFSPLGLISEPTYEQEVVFLFSKFHKKLGFPLIVKIRGEFPDAIVMDNNKEQKKIEFEIFSSQFNHDPKGCDYIICWENDLTEEQIKRKRLPKIISLKEELET